MLYFTVVKFLLRVEVVWLQRNIYKESNQAALWKNGMEWVFLCVAPYAWYDSLFITASSSST